MPDTLNGLIVVVTRPPHQAARFQQMLEAAGAQVVLFPLMSIQSPGNPGQVLARLAQLHTYDVVLFISANAVAFGMALLDEGQKQVLASLTVGAIGKKTAQALNAQGLPVHWVPANGFTSEDFLALPAVQHLDGKRILIFRGDGGRELLAETLRKRGAVVEYVDVYQRICPQISPLVLKQHHEQRQLDIIAITSSEGIGNLLALAGSPDWITTIPLLVGSQRMVETARQAGFTGNLVLANDPGDEAMFAALTNWVQEKRP